jgi:iron uptake system component EfeO
MNHRCSIGGAALTALLAGLALSACGNSNGGGSPGARHIAVTLSDDGCAPPTSSIASGPTTFDIKNDSSSKVTELELQNTKGIIVAERENITAGLSGSFSLDVKPGKYTLNCPNAKTDSVPFTVTGAPVAAGRVSPDAQAATSGYRDYVQKKTGELKAATTKWVAALKSGDLKEAKDEFGPTRRYYEAVEPDAESFGDLDPSIDARENDVASPDEWTGFHRIEKILWKDGTTKGTAKYAKKLAGDVVTLDTKARSLDFQPAQLANGAVELLNEVASSKITGEEDRYSHTDLSDFAGNLEGAKKAFELLRPALAKKDAKLATTLDARFAEVQQGLDKYKRSTPLGYALYDELTDTDRKQLAAQVDALAEPLSTVAAKVAG